MTETMIFTIFLNLDIPSFINVFFIKHNFEDRVLTVLFAFHFDSEQMHIMRNFFQELEIFIFKRHNSLEFPSK